MLPSEFMDEMQGESRQQIFIDVESATLFLTNPASIFLDQCSLSDKNIRNN
jgi:hypothetical protein